jgi:hypothetical protein
VEEFGGARKAKWSNQQTANKTHPQDDILLTSFRSTTRGESKGRRKRTPMW